ncbi:Uma2 family endonuclease [Nonomuraea sp. CA-218870]|uniref:Uma2 family endonuclease n=1 Tax=Nonomuraea sp. CA-218870 TaxID=3239998 RepID=UPI003D936BBB
MTTAFPDWFYPGPPGGWTADMLDHLPPDAPPHVELIDGGLILMSPQTGFHMLVIDLLKHPTLGIRPPERFLVVREMTVTLGMRQRPEPNVLVVEESAFSPDITSFKPDDVHLAVEVVSEESRERDRTTKPIKYSDAGIPHFWRVEREKNEPVVHTFELDPAVRAYLPTGVHRGRLKTDIDFPIDIDLDLSALTR